MFKNESIKICTFKNKHCYIYVYIYIYVCVYVCVRARVCIFVLIRDIRMWIPSHGRAKVGRPARTYLQQLCTDTGCSIEDLPRTMNDRDEKQERVWEIRASCIGMIIYLSIYLSIYLCIYIYIYTGVEQKMETF